MSNLESGTLLAGTLALGNFLVACTLLPASLTGGIGSGATPTATGALTWLTVRDGRKCWKASTPTRISATRQNIPRRTTGARHQGGTWYGTRVNEPGAARIGVSAEVSEELFAELSCVTSSRTGGTIGSPVFENCNPPFASLDNRWRTSRRSRAKSNPR